MCISPETKRKTSYLSMSKFRKIIDEFPFLEKISLVGAGEPLLNSELFDMIDYCKVKKIRVGFATNGMLMSEKTSEKIISSGLNWLNISMDGATKDTYEKIRKGADFNLLINNISMAKMIISKLINKEMIK
jgi:MoaA/NifB/PqqE/SkfB family radical SAM enzyme